MYRLLLITLVIAPFALAQKPGSCPRISGYPLDINRAVGTWYLNSRSGTFADDGLKCGRITWNQPTGSNFTLAFRSISTITNEITSVVVEGNANSPTFRHHVPVLGIVDVNYVVFGADYSRYLILYNCNNQGNTYNENVSIYSRQQFPDMTALNNFVDQAYRYWGLQRPPPNVNNQNCRF